MIRTEQLELYKRRAKEKSNNHGNINGWVTKRSIYGKVVEIL